MAKLVRGASGARHLRWANEILAIIRAHIEINTSLSASQRQALEKEAAVLQARIEGLHAAVTPYRGFLDTAHINVRAHQRVANFMCDEVMEEADGRLRHRASDIDAVLPGGLARIFSGLPLSRVLRAGHTTTVSLVRAAAQIVAALPSTIPGAQELAEKMTSSADRLDRYNQQLRDEVEPQRAPLRLAVELAIGSLRESLEQIDGRLRTHFTHSFIDSLYPELSRKRTAVIDDFDDETDDTLPPEPNLGQPGATDADNNPPEA